MKLETGIYRHFKGGTSFVYGLSKAADDTTQVLYIGMEDKQFHNREISEFFEIINNKGVQVERFTLVEPIKVTPETILEIYTRAQQRSK